MTPSGSFTWFASTHALLVMLEMVRYRPTTQDNHHNSATVTDYEQTTRRGGKNRSVTERPTARLTVRSRGFSVNACATSAGSSSRSGTQEPMLPIGDRVSLSRNAAACEQRGPRHMSMLMSDATVVHLRTSAVKSGPHQVTHWEAGRHWCSRSLIPSMSFTHIIVTLTDAMTTLVLYLSPSLPSSHF